MSIKFKLDQIHFVIDNMYYFLILLSKCGGDVARFLHFGTLMFNVCVQSCYLLLNVHLPSQETKIHLDCMAVIVI